MRTILEMRGILVCAVASAVFLAACTSSGNGSEPTTRPSAPARPALGTTAPAKQEPAYNNRDLAKLLVPISEAPNGFSVRSPDKDQGKETQVCDADAFPSAQRTARAGVSFTKAQVVISEKLTSYASAKAAESVMQNARAAYQRCKAFDETDDHGVVTHYTLAALSFDRLADDQVAFRVTFTTNALSGAGDFVAARVGGLIMVTAGLSVASTSSPAQLEAGDFASFTKTAYERIT